MKLTSVAILSMTLILSQTALAKSKKVRVSKGTVTSSSEESASNGEPESTSRAGRLAATNTRESSDVSATKTGSARPYRYITDGGRPAPGSFLISPMVGQYALTGLEYGVKGSYQIADHAFIPALNNSISAEVEVFKGAWHGFFGRSESMFYGGSGRWDFHLAPKWTVYGAVGLQMEYKQTIADIEVSESNITPNMQVGGMLILAPNFRLRGEFDYAHASYRFGIVCAL